MKPIASPAMVALSLRVLAVFLVLNSITVLLPTDWINSVLVWCGLGRVPEAMLFHYLLRGSGVLLVAFAVLIWIIASDVARYQPLVIAISVVFLVGAPVSWGINILVGLPGWWRMLDAAICMLGGGIPLFFCFWPEKAKRAASGDAAYNTPSTPVGEAGCPQPASGNNRTYRPTGSQPQ
jgi:hypothetical protein